MNEITIEKRLLFAAAFLLGILVVPSIAVSSSNENSRDFDVSSMILDRAENFVELPTDASLEYLGLTYDEFWQKELWSVRWMTESHNLIEVQFEKESLELVFFVDDTEPVGWELVDETIAFKTAWSTIMGFVNDLELRELSTQIVDARISTVRRTSDGWMLEWSHEVDGVSVANDFIRVSTNAMGSRVQAYAKCWHPVSIDTKPEIDSEQAVLLFNNLIDNAQSATLSVRLSIVRNFGNHYLVWIVDSKSQEIWVDAKNGYLIFYDSVLSDDYQDSYAHDLYWDLQLQRWRQNIATYQTASGIQKRLRTGTSSFGSPRSR